MPRSANRIRFSKQALAAIKPTDKTQYFWDDGCPGLGVRVSPKGKLAFVYQDVHGKRTSLKQTRLDSARAESHRRRGIQESINDSDSWTLKDLFDTWVETKAKPRKRTWKRDVRRYEQYLEPWSKKKIRSITRPEVIRLHNEINETVGPYAANDTIAFLASMYKYAVQYDYSGPNPAQGIERFPEQERERYLLPEEFPRWHEAVSGLRLSVSRDFFLLLLWTGIRRENVMQMRWDQLDLQARTWRIPAGINKSKRDQIVYLSDMAMAVLERRRSHAQGPWVLPSPRSSSSGHYADPKSAWRQVLEKSGIQDLRIHDLRRTLGSWMAEGGTSLHVIGKTLGHTTLQSTAIYARLGGTAVRAAVNDATQRMQETLLSSEHTPSPVEKNEK